MLNWTWKVRYGLTGKQAVFATLYMLFAGLIVVKNLTVAAIFLNLFMLGLILIHINYPEKKDWIKNGQWVGNELEMSTAFQTSNCISNRQPDVYTTPENPTPNFLAVNFKFTWNICWTEVTQYLKLWRTLDYCNKQSPFMPCFQRKKQKRNSDIQYIHLKKGFSTQKYDKIAWPNITKKHIKTKPSPAFFFPLFSSFKIEY